MQYLVALADAGSLEEGAKSLDIAPSTLSRSMNQLSRDIGAPLFIRGRRLLLTTAGEKCLQYARQIVYVYEHTYQILRSMAGVQQHFSIGMAPHFDARMFSAIFERFQSLYPTVRIDVTESYSRDAVDMLLHNRLDIAVGVWDDDILRHSGIVFLPVQEIEYIVAIARTHPLAKGGAHSGDEEDRMPRRNLADFKEVPYIDSDPRALYHRGVQQLFSEQQFEPQRMNRSGSIPISRAMITHYNAFAICPLDNADDTGTLQYFRLNPSFTCIKGFYLRQGLKLNTCIFDFLTLFAEQMKSGYRHSASIYPSSFTIPDDLLEKEEPIHV